MSINLKLWLLGIIALIALAVSFGVTEIGAIFVHDAVMAEEKALVAEINMLEARRSEKDFLARKQTKYIERNSEHTTKAKEELQELLHYDAEHAKLVETAVGLLDQYASKFEEVSDNILKLGQTENDGLRGTLRAAIQQVESVITAKNDDRLLAGMLMLRRHEKDFMLRGHDKYLERFNKDMDVLESKVNASVLITPEDAAEILKLLEAYSQSFNNFSITSNAIEEGRKEFTKAVQALEPILTQLGELSSEKRTERQTLVTRTTIIVSAGAALLLFVCIILLIRSIITPLTLLQECSMQVAEGDYEACTRHSFSGELEGLRKDIVAMVDNLKDSMDTAKQSSLEAQEKSLQAEEAMQEAENERAHVAGLLEKMSTVAAEANELVEYVTESADELTSIATEISSGTDAQSRRVEETATAMNEMNATVLEVARNASDAAEGADSARNMVHEGVEIVHQVETSSTEVAQRSNDMKISLADLGKQVDDIGSIMQVIDDIADQTNLLALNAAIEAARAGEAGRGFAVVADEVRKLAEKTMVATKEVADAILGIQEGSQRNIKAMEGASVAVTQSTELAQQAGVFLLKIEEIVNETSVQVSSIATAAEEQSAASEQINAATDEVNRITMETAQGVRQSVEAIENVSRLANRLRTVIRDLNTDK